MWSLSWGRYWDNGCHYRWVCRGRAHRITLLVGEVVLAVQEVEEGSRAEGKPATKGAGKATGAGSGTLVGMVCHVYGCT